MMTLLIFSVLVGAVLGMRLKVFILVPTIGLALIIIAVVGALRGDEMPSIALAMILAAIGLQTGYLVGSATSTFAAGTRDPHRHGIGMPATAMLAGDRQPISD